MDYEIIPEGERFRVKVRGALQRGKFHTAYQAQEWINLQMEKEEARVRNRVTYPGRASAGMQPDIYGENLLNVPS